MRDHSIIPVVAGFDEHAKGGVTVEVFRDGKVTSKDFVGRYRKLQHPPEMARALVAGLERLDEHGTLLVTAEEFARLFKSPDPAFADAINSLAERHRVRLAYYVRPQHTAIEATWCQMGFRHRSLTPSAWIMTVYQSYRYHAIARRCRAAMPKVEFVVRPFRRDLLSDGDVITDFASEILGMEAVPGAHEIWSNPSLPLEAVNLLHCLPRDVISLRSSTDLAVVKRCLAGWAPEEPEAIVRSRLVLQHFCHETYENTNLRLIKHEGWQAEHFVPPVPDGTLTDGERQLEALDRLWSPSATAAERELVYLLLKGLLQATRPRD